MISVKAALSTSLLQVPARALRTRSLNYPHDNGQVFPEGTNYGTFRAKPSPRCERAILKRTASQHFRRRFTGYRAFPQDSMWRAAVYASCVFRHQIEYRTQQNDGAASRLLLAISNRRLAVPMWLGIHEPESSDLRSLGKILVIARHNQCIGFL